MTNTQNLTDKKITGKQRTAISVILQAPSIVEGCRKAGISRETWYAWLKNPAVKEEWERQRGAAIDEALHTLKASLGDAVDTLTALLKAEGALGEGTRLKASLAILESVFKVREMEEIEARLSAIERSLKK